MITRKIFTYNNRIFEYGDRVITNLGTNINLLVWLRADAGVVEVLGKVSEWQDMTGNGWHASQSAAANRPVLVTDPDGVKGIQFTAGSATWLETVANSILNPLDFTYFVVYNKPTDNSTGGLLSMVIPTWTGMQMAAYASRSDFAKANGSYNALAYNHGLHGNRLIMTYANLGTVADCYINGVHIGQHNKAITFATATKVTFGRSSAGAANYLTGKIHEIIMFDRKLTTQEIEEVHIYLKSKYGI